MLSNAFQNRKQPTFSHATTGFPTKWRLRNELKKISYAGRSVESIACIADVKVVAVGGGGAGRGMGV